jgi:hypothetical protein
MFIPVWLIIIIVVLYSVKLYLRYKRNTCFKKWALKFLNNNLSSFDSTFTILNKTFHFYKNENNNFVLKDEGNKE